ncbi:hypothetical protein [Xanthomonas translucens]|uniref:hypothetical protein n=1 Tax=Xanthomonas campestris pv. translucens TaxID=343 RepID=UPI001F60CD92|nr:hypothetical protein [Xanthomonas translucens]UNU12602.1 hypothetical protein KBV71_07860 [Xanthomonas translucens pv. translucens]
MRDEKDPGTLEMPLPRKRGRPIKYDRAMTPAERAAMYRINRKTLAYKVSVDDAELVHLSDAVLLDRLRMDIADGHKLGVKAMLKELSRRHT